MSAKGQAIQLTILKAKMDAVVKQLAKIEKREQNEFLRTPAEGIGPFILRDNPRFLASVHLQAAKDLVEKAATRIELSRMAMTEVLDVKRTSK